MLNCPATNNTCPARKHKAQYNFRDVLSMECSKAYDGLPVDDAVYAATLTILREILADGCNDCVRNTVIALADLGWPPHRGIQQVFVAYLLAGLPAVH